jgi:hypothetical protein
MPYIICHEFKVEQDSKMFQDSCRIEIKIFFQDSHISRSSSSDFSLNASQNFPRYIFSCHILTTPKIILKNSDDKDDDDDDDDDEVSQIILINKFVKLHKFTSQSV